MEFKQKKQAFSFPQPLIRDLSKVQVDNQLNPPPLYSYFQSKHSSIPSSKIIRSTHSKPTIGKRFNLIVQPFYPTVQIATIKKQIRCTNCGAYMSPQNSIKSSCEYICIICNQSGYIDPQHLDLIKSHSIYDIQDDTQKQTQRILIVLEATQFIYQHKVQQAIKCCVNGFIDCNYQFGFILYDEKDIYLINIQQNSLVILSTKHDVPEIPLPLHYIFAKPTHKHMQNIFNNINQILYESFLIKNTCWQQVQQFLLKNFGKQYNVHCKVFLTSLHNFIEQNIIHKEQKKIPVDYFIINENCSYERCMKILKRQVYRIFNKISNNVSDMYYALFHNIQLDYFRHAKFKFYTSKYIKAVKEEITYYYINSSNPIVFQFIVNNQLSEMESIPQQFIQIEILTASKSSPINFNKRIINFSIKEFIKIKHLREQFQAINDESYAYVLIRDILEKNQLSKYNNELISQMKAIVGIVQQKNKDILFPKKLCHLFLYAYMIKNHDFMMQNQISRYKKHLFLTEGLETIIKKLYLRTYETFPELKNISSSLNKLEVNKTYLIQNGQTLYLVLGDQCTNDALTEIFGQNNKQNLLDINELPIIQSNKQLREQIELIRSRNELYYLRMKILYLDTDEFYEEVGRYLYSVEECRKFLQTIYNKKSKTKKC